MDDPIFDPWGFESEAPPPTAPANRWRAPSGLTPTPPATARSGPRGTLSEIRGPAPLPRARLAGTAGFLRSMAVPRIEEIARRLQLARHRAVLEDLLEGAPPLLRLTVHPWRGPWTKPLAPPVGVFELRIEPKADEELTLRLRLDLDADQPHEEVTLQVSQLNGASLDARVLEFVEKLLARA